MIICYMKRMFYNTYNFENKYHIFFSKCYVIPRLIFMFLFFRNENIIQFNILHFSSPLCNKSHLQTIDANKKYIYRKKGY